MAATGSLESFRQSLARLRGSLEEASRTARFKPPTDLAAGALHLLPQGSSFSPDSELPGGGGIVAEILDVSSEGMKLAISDGQTVQAGQGCHLTVRCGPSESFALGGTVRWVEQSSFITVFGIQLSWAERLAA
ncbi:MAG: PilZ domain-containing protein [Synechococcaceae cyanobacterium]|nr:PilZ domain-containing protein [Synechococcaceae cyanobacterium]